MQHDIILRLSIIFANLLQRILWKMADGKKFFQLYMGIYQSMEEN